MLDALPAAAYLRQAPLLSPGSLADLFPHTRTSSQQYPVHLRTETALSSASATLSSTVDNSYPTLISSPFLLTLRIVRLVNTFRKRAKTGLRARPRQPTRKQDLCQDLERAACEQVDRYLGRRTRRPYRNGTSWTRLTDKEAEDTQSIDRLIGQINASVSYQDSSLTAIAKDNRLFLDRKANFHVPRLPLHEHIGLTLNVKKLLASLRRTFTRRSSVKTVCEGNEILDFTLEEIANFEHLLLCLQEQLVRLLLSQCIDLVWRHILDCQKDQNKYSEDWFFTFPDARHPLSTTWPWSIRPSLAVIWGVCWMFYDFSYCFDSDGNMVDVVTGVLLAPAPAVREAMSAYRQQDWPSLYFPASSREQTGSLGRSSQSSGSAFQNLPRPIGFGVGSSACAPPHTSQASNLASPIATLPSHQTAITIANHLALGPAGTVSNSPAAQPPATASSGVANWLPQENFDSGSISSITQDSAYVAAPGWRQPQQQQFGIFDIEQALPRGLQQPRNPTIITTDLSAYSPSHQTPQDVAAYYSASSTPSMPLHEDTVNYSLPYSATLSPQQQTRPYMQQDMNTPVSPISPHSPHPNGEQMSRKRSHSQMRGDEVPYESVHQSREGSAGEGMNSTSPRAEEFGSARGSRTFKRGEPPMNADNKYYCAFTEECAGVTFDRKCEWSKHMDKHDRPYRCQHASCAKLQGFTYSGGLLRHEREVHNKHGGPKSQMMCPYPDCKRHTGKGFTRKENLNEHVRRVHESKGASQSQQPSQGNDYQAEELQQAAQGAEQEISQQLDHDQHPPLPPTMDDIGNPLPHQTGKRKRLEDVEDVSSNTEDLREEVKRLRTENADKDDLLNRIQAEQAQDKQQIYALQQQLLDMQNAHHQAQAQPQPQEHAQHQDHAPQHFEDHAQQQQQQQQQQQIPVEHQIEQLMQASDDKGPV